MSFFSSLVASSALAINADLPNIIFLLTDDQGWGDVGYNKEVKSPPAGGGNFTYNPPRTPNIDDWATGPGSLLFERSYSGSAVCSPTRASVLSGRSPVRECIDWASVSQPFPATVPTVAGILKDHGYKTLQIGKWHLGPLWVDDLIEADRPAPPLTPGEKRWKTANPGNLGFGEYHATLTSCPVSYTNCGCNANWPHEGKGCVVGGGKYLNRSILPPDDGNGLLINKNEACQTYWSAASGVKNIEGCSNSTEVSRACLANYTDKIVGDDTLFQVNIFENFLNNTNTDEEKFFVYWPTHANHAPHYAMPEWFHAYKDALGNWAGDYLGVLSQLDAAIGALRAVLKARGLEENTLVWYTADNGPHTLADKNSVDPTAASRSGGQLAATNGLRQCKASVFEGGIRVPGFVVWPKVLGSGHKRTSRATITMDFLPTVLDILGASYPKPGFALDGISILPLLQGKVSLDAQREKGIGWWVKEQLAFQIANGTDIWKLVVKPEMGQCQVMLPPYHKGVGSAPLLFNLANDDTESVDLAKTHPDQYEVMKQLLKEWKDTVVHSKDKESECFPLKHTEEEL